MRASALRGRETPPLILVLTAVVSLAVTACASVSDGCRKETAECIERCEASTDERGSQYEILEPENTMSRCEAQCGCRDPSPPKPQGKPTATGNAPTP